MLCWICYENLGLLSAWKNCSRNTNVYLIPCAIQIRYQSKPNFKVDSFVWIFMHECIFQTIYNQGGDYRRQCGQGVGSEKGKNVTV